MNSKESLRSKIYTSIVMIGLFLVLGITAADAITNSDKISSKTQQLESKEVITIERTGR